MTKGNRSASSAPPVLLIRALTLVTIVGGFAAGLVTGTAVAETPAQFIYRKPAMRAFSRRQELV
jgi:hypothetical protein